MTFRKTVCVCLFYKMSAKGDATRLFLYWLIRQPCSMLTPLIFEFLFKDSLKLFKALV